MKNIENELFAGKMNGRTMARIVRLVLPHFPLAIGFIVAAACIAFVDSINTYMSRFLIDSGAIGGDPRELVRYATNIAGLFAVNAVFIFILFYCAGRLSEKLQFDLRKTMFGHILTLSFSFFDKTSSGWLLSRITSDAQRIAQLTSWMLLDSIWGSMNIIIAMAFMISINWKLAIVAGVTIPLIVATAVVFQRKIVVEYRTVRAMNSKITQSFTENIGGIRVVKSHTREDRNLADFRGLSTGMHAASFRAGWLSAIFLPAVQLVVSAGVAAILLVGGRESTAGGLTFGSLRAFIGYIIFMLWPVQDLARVMAEMQQAIASAERVFALIDTRPDIVDAPNAITSARFDGHVEFRGVGFGYREGIRIIDGLDLCVSAGERIALVGPTGGGKTTIVSLVARFYEPTSGTILFDGKDYREYAQIALRKRIGIVLQHPHLFSGTVRENLLYGKPDASNNDLERACRLVCAHEMIMRLPAGYDEDVGEGGRLLSVGQRQLVTLARVFLADPDVIIMDEATSSIDTLTERALQAGVAALLHQRTSFIIAHRLSTIRDADRICFIEQGKIVESGTHSGLLGIRGRYYRLYTNQMRLGRRVDCSMTG